MDRIGEFLPFMLEGAVTTVEIFILTLVISLPLGLPIALGSNSRFKPLSFLDFQRNAADASAVVFLFFISVSVRNNP